MRFNLNEELGTEELQEVRKIVISLSAAQYEQLAYLVEKYPLESPELKLQDEVKRVDGRLVTESTCGADEHGAALITHKLETL